MIQVREAHLQAMRDYQPSSIDCPLLLFKSSVVDDKFEIPEDYGWKRITPDVQIIDVPGRHLDMFDEPHVSTLAREINLRLLQPPPS
jgi:thioesterase domain-containing protein